MAARTLRRMAISSAIGALIEDRDRRLTARPLHWSGSGESLLLHGGNLYRLAPGLEPLSGPAYPIDASMIVSTWEVLPAATVIAESDPNAKREPVRRKRPQKAPATRGKVGRRTAAEVRLELPEEEREAWQGVAEVAALFGVGRDRVRRAISGGALPVRFVASVCLVDVERARRLFDLTLDVRVDDPEVYQ